jgi:hypothetical protein
MIHKHVIVKHKNFRMVPLRVVRLAVAEKE